MALFQPFVNFRFVANFYRAMLCIRGTSHGPVSVCPSVRLSVCPSQVGVPVPILRFKVRSTDAWRARRARAYNGGLGRSPQRGPGAEPLVRGSGGLKLKAFQPFNVQ